jgi:hypothetical protein
MRTVSLEMAKKLKEAGLQHQIVYGDWYLAWLPTEETYLQKPVLYDYTAYGPYEEDIWLPTLSDLLEWLEERGYYWSMHRIVWGDGTNKYLTTVYEMDVQTGHLEEVQRFVSNTPEDTVAKAVLLLLEQERESKNGDR